MRMEMKKTKLILYHGSCLDGFAGAWAAWKKFGDTAEYRAVERTTVPDSSIFQDREVYVIDYSFSQEEMMLFESAASSFICIDHHISAQNAVTSLRSYVFDTQHSGAWLAWKYFHPDTEIPKMIEYISDSDTWAHALPDYEQIEAYIYRDTELRYTFSYMNALHQELSTEEGFQNAKRIGALFREAYEGKIKTVEASAELVLFEGYTVYAVNAPREIRSELGHRLAEKTKSFSLLFLYEGGFWKCSLRSVSDFDVSVIAQKYGGGGHKNAAGFVVSTHFPLPFVTGIA